MICCPCESDDIASEGKNAGSTSHYEYLNLVWPNVFRASRLLGGNASRVNIYISQARYRKHKLRSIGSSIEFLGSLNPWHKKLPRSVSMWKPSSS